MPDSLPLRCHRPLGMEGLPTDEWRATLNDAIRAAEVLAEGERRTRGFGVLGRQRVLKQRPTDRPRLPEPRRRLKPRVAASNKWARVEALQRNKVFQVAYRVARELWQAGQPAVFPQGTYWLQRFASVTVEPAPT